MVQIFRRVMTLLLGGASLLTQADSTDMSNMTALLTAEHRSVEHRARDQYRHPLETLAFFEVKASDTVVEIWPGAGWYTEILAPFLQQKGQFYAAHWAQDSTVAFYRRSRIAFDAKLQGQPKVYGAVKVTELEPLAHMSIAPAGRVDKVLTFRNVHNWMKSGKDSNIFTAMFQALKPGGILGIVEHRAPASRSIDDMIASGYVSEEHVKILAKQAGFVFVGSSEVNANKRDLAEHPRGVWTLPPSLRLGDKQKLRYLAIGESDRMTLKFVKPKKLVH